MKHLIIPIIYIGALLLCSCHDSINLPDDDVKATRTVVVYMMAENSLSRYSQSDVSEIVRAADSIPKDCNLVVYLDNALAPTIFTVSADKGMSTWKTLPEENSADSAVFEKNLKDIIKQYPAKSYGLVMWSHGSGWLPQPRKSIGVDNCQNSTSLDEGSELEIPTMRGALEQTGVHWDYILFDACFMQCVEVAYELRKVTDWCICSPAEIPGKGAPYDKIMPYLMRGDVKNIVDTYYADCKNNTGVVISAAQSSRMDTLATATRQLIPTLFAGRKEVATEGMQTYGVFTSQSVWKTEYYDMGSVISQLASTEEYAEWARVADLAIPYRHATDTWTTDYWDFDPTLTDALHDIYVSMFVPNSKYDTQGYNEYLHQFQWYKAAGWDQTGW